MLALLTIGVVMVNSATLGVTPVAGASAVGAGGLSPAAGAVGGAGVKASTQQPLSLGGVFFTSATAHMVLALVMMLVAAMMPLREWVESARESLSARGPRGGYLLLTAGVVGLLIVLVTVYVPGLGQEKNGSHRWVVVPGLGDGLSAQPSEIAKWAFPLLMAMYCAVMAARMRGFWAGLVPALLAMGCVAGFIVIEDLGTGVLLAAACCIVLLAGGARVWHFLLFVPLGVLGVVGAVLKSPYRVERITTFLDPFKDPEGAGYHQVQSLIAIAGGQGVGRGLGFGLQSKGYLPEDRTDFLFAIICEELGIPGAAAVILLFVLLLWAAHSIVRRERDVALKLFALGVTCTIGIQAVINLAVVTVVAPTKGIALPLISAGGTGWILTAFSLGLLISIDRSQTEVSSLRTPVVRAGVEPGARGSLAA